MSFFPLHVAIKVSQHHLLKMLSTAVIIVGLLRDYCRSAVSFGDQWVFFEARDRLFLLDLYRSAAQLYSARRCYACH